MNEQEIKAAFAAMDREHPFYRAVQALLDDEVAQETFGAALVKLPNEQRQFNAGRLAHALDFRNAFSGVMSEAISAQTAANQRAEQQAARRASDQ